MGNTNIEWTDETWNPVRGCTPIAPGCANCYATRQAIRQAGKGGAYEGLVKSTRGGPKWTGKVRVSGDKSFYAPLHWRKPRRIFVNSMSDLFHEGLSDEAIDKVFAVMAICSLHERRYGHVFQILTKRHARMRAYLGERNDQQRRKSIAAKGAALMEDGDMWHETLHSDMQWPLENVWMGVSVSDQETANAALDDLAHTSAWLRFVSYEPALGPIDFTPWLHIAWQCSGCHAFFPDPWKKTCPKCGREDYWSGSHAYNPRAGQRGSCIDWLIVGGESGPRSRPCDVAWVRSTIEQCKAARVPCFVKQMGARVRDGRCDRCNGTGEFARAKQVSGPPLPRLACPSCSGDGGFPIDLEDAKGGDMNEWPEQLRVREWPEPKEGDRT